ncbi:MAG TPA: glycosyltransferase family 2 protein [Blastocatellia bacterium]|nr:glycosyltransferase family 2 protein [Blastocatellia bacterium]
MEHDQGKPTGPAARAISVVVPLYNEQLSLKELHERLAAVLPQVATHHEIIFVDDGSVDDSVETLRAISVLDRAARFVRFRRNFGKSAALAAGFRVARYGTIVTLDADLQDIPEQLPLLVDKLDEGYDLVSGWRRDRRDRLTRRLGSRLYNWVTSALTGVRLHDINCGFKIYRREVLDEVLVYGERHRYIPVLASYRGFRLGEVSIEHAERAYGSSRYGFSRVFGGFFSLLTVILLTRYTNKPLHFFGILGLGLASVGTAIDAYLVLMRILAHEWLSNRPLLIIGTLLAIVGVQLVLFGLLAEMIAFSYRRESDYSIVESSDDEYPGLTSSEHEFRIGRSKTAE